MKREIMLEMLLYQRIQDTDFFITLLKSGWRIIDYGQLKRAQSPDESREYILPASVMEGLKRHLKSPRQSTYISGMVIWESKYDIPSGGTSRARYGNISYSPVWFQGG